MYRLLIASLIVASVSTVVGCGASGAARQSTVPSSNVADTRDDSSWTPPEAMEGTIVTSQDARAATSRETVSTSYRPNREQRPTHGAVHAATY